MKNVIICENCKKTSTNRIGDACEHCGSCAHCGRDSGLEYGPGCRWSDCPSNYTPEDDSAEDVFAVTLTFTVPGEEPETEVLYLRAGEVQDVVTEAQAACIVSVSVELI